MIVVLLACLGLRLLLFALFQPWTSAVEWQRVLTSDGRGYHQIATTLLTSGRFAYAPARPPDALRTPGYPLFIAGIYSLFGPRPWIVLLFQILLDTLACLLLFLMTLRRLGGTAALAAAWFYAVDPFLVLYSSTTLFSDSLLVFLLVAGLWAFFTFGPGDSREKPARRELAATALFGVMLGLAALVKPVAEYIVVCAVLYLVVVHRKRPGRAAATAAVALAAFVLTLTPWLVRNQRTFGTASLSTSGSFNLLVLDVGPMEMALHHLGRAAAEESLLVEADRLIEADHRDPHDINPFRKAEYWRRVAVAHIRDNPVLFARSYGLGILHMFFNLGTGPIAETLGLPAKEMEVKAYSNPLAMARDFVAKKGAAGLLIGVVVGMILAVTYICAAAGLIVAWRSPAGRPVFLLVLLLALYFVLITGVAGLARLKLPVIPFYLVFAGVGFSHLYRHGKWIRRPSGN